MEFVNKKLEKTGDISKGKGSQLWELGKLTMMTLGIVVVLYLIVSLVVDAVVANISVETEKRLFSAFSSPSAKLPKGLNEGTKEEFARLEQILEKLAAHPDVPALDYRLFSMPNSKPNAFAFPGGGVGVTTGLLNELEDDIAFAFVIGHELGHFHNRDHLRGLGRSIGMSVCFALVFGGSCGGELLAGNALNIMSRKYSRIQEAAADRFGVKLVRDVYGKTEGVDQLFKILKEKDKAPKWAYMWSTHPRTSDRIEELKRYADTQ